MGSPWGIRGHRYLETCDEDVRGGPHHPSAAHPDTSPHAGRAAGPHTARSNSSPKSANASERFTTPRRNSREAPRSRQTSARRTRCARSCQLRRLRESAGPEDARKRRRPWSTIPGCRSLEGSCRERAPTSPGRGVASPHAPVTCGALSVRRRFIAGSTPAGCDAHCCARDDGFRSRRLQALGELARGSPGLVEALDPRVLARCRDAEPLTAETPETRRAPWPLDREER